MKPRRWQIVWTVLVVLWLGGWAWPMVLLLLRGDTEQLAIYAGMWVAIVLVPTVVVYVVGLLFGACLSRATRSADTTQRARPSRVWLAGVLGWALLVGLFCVSARSALNPFMRFPMPLAVAVAILIVLLPPALVYGARLGLQSMHRKVSTG